MSTSVRSEILMPQLGQAMVTGVLVAWRKQDGEAVASGEPLLTIESDKSAFDIDAPASGVLKQLIPAGVEAEVGTLLGVIDTGRELNSGINGGPQQAPPKSSAETRVTTPSADRPLASPKARAVAGNRVDLSKVRPTGPDGLITAADVQRELGKGPAHQEVGAAHRSAIKRLQTSWTQAPHIVQFIEVNADRLVRAQSLARAGHLPATLNDIIVQAAAETMLQFKDLNGYVDGDSIVFNDDVHISLAVATDRGLRTPIIESVAGLALEEVAARTRSVIAAAKDGRSVSGQASLTISNLGRHGVRAGTPVLNLNESVLVFVGAIVERPVVENGAIIPRPEMTLSVAFDHRIADGLRAAEFSSSLRDRLENFDLSPWDDEPITPVPERSVQLTSRGGLRCDLSDGRRQWVIDEPIAVGGTNGGTDPVTSFLGSLLSCLCIAFKLVATRRKIPVETMIGNISANSTGKVREVSVRLEVWASAPVAQLEGLLKPAKAACYIHDLLRPDLNMEVKVVGHDTTQERPDSHQVAVPSDPASDLASRDSRK